LFSWLLATRSRQNQRELLRYQNLRLHIRFNCSAQPINYKISSRISDSCAAVVIVLRVKNVRSFFCCLSFWIKMRRYASGTTWALHSPSAR
jgi:hypothetical protein